jgi:hypothetical protein
MIEKEISTLSHGTRFEEALPTAVRWSHALLAPRLRPGDVAVDATMGNGYDTVFLARHVMPGGHVFSFDVQAEALEMTRRRISDLTLHDGVTLIHAGHETMERHLPADLQGKVRAFMFNFGWLPGAQNKGKTTLTETSLQALGIARAWIAEGGMITAVCYPGHAGGDTEAEAVEAWAAELPADQFEAQKLAFVNLEGAPPRCFVVRKRFRGSGK